ncbi:MAG: murein biosynthesis integral membrane protein MurJ [Pseudomonadota bacterium]
MSTDALEPQSPERGQKAPDMGRQGSIVAAMTMLSRITGLLRDIALSYLFGASQYADMFFVALRIPNLFRRLFAEGAFNQAFVPVLIRYRDRGREDLKGFLRPLLGWFSLILLSFCVVGVLAAEYFAMLFAPGFIDTPGQFAQTVELVRITFPYLAFVSLTAYAGAILNAHNRFALPAITPVMLNLCLLGGAGVAMAGWVHLPDVEVMAWAVFVAGAVQLAIQLPATQRLGLVVRPRLERAHPGVRQVTRLLGPAVFSASVGQINALVNTILASTLMTGSISWLYFADRLMELPIGLVAVALGTVLLPHLSGMAARGDDAAFRRTMAWGTHLATVLSLPAAVALYVFAEPIIAAVFMSVEGTAMTTYDARMAGYALQMFALALPPLVLVKIFAPGYFAHQDTRTPFIYATIAVGVNLAASLATFTWFGHVGLAWATALSAWVHAFLLYVGLTRSGRLAIDRPSAWRLGRSALASVSLGVGLALATEGVAWLEMAPLVRVLWVLTVCAVGMGVYALLMFALGLRLKDLRQSGVTPGPNAS